MYACCLPKTCPVSTSTILLKNEEIGAEKWSEPFFKPNHEPNPGIRGVLSVRFLQLSLLEGGCADASFTTYKPSFGSSLAFILGWLQHQVIKRDGWIRKKHPCCPNHCLIKPETCSIYMYIYNINKIFYLIIYINSFILVYIYIHLFFCLRVLHAFAYCVLLQDNCLLMCHMPKGACRLGSPRPLGITVYDSIRTISDATGTCKLPADLRQDLHNEGFVIAVGCPPSLDPDVMCVPLIFHQSLDGSSKKAMKSPCYRSHTWVCLIRFEGWKYRYLQDLPTPGALGITLWMEHWMMGRRTKIRRVGE